MASKSDQRHLGPSKPVATYQITQQSWATGAGHAAKTTDLANLNGMLERIDIIISSVTDNPTVDVTLTDSNSCTLVSLTGLADGTKHVKLAYSNKSSPDADFNPIPINDTVTVSIDPSADAGGTAQTLTVDVILYVR
jgi:hypothetical protein